MVTTLDVRQRVEGKELPSVWSPVARESLRHMPQLDALRALAVGGVIVHHYWPQWGLGHWGSWGVHLFFVLSGFLITAILLNCRRLVEAGQSLLFTTRQFYARRFLRIFPVFYLMLAVNLLAGGSHARQTVGWHASYLSNVYFASRGRWDDAVSHFWSLAVEEQFYLVWPWLTLSLSKRLLVPVTAAMILAGPIFRGVANSWGLNEVACMALPFAQLDSLGLGALLALCFDPAYVRRQRLPYLGTIIAIIGAAGIVLAYLPVASHLILERTFLQVGVESLFVLVVAGAAIGFGGWVGAVLTFRPLTYLGTISYGLYVFHNFVPGYVQRLHVPATIAVPLSPLICLAVATISFRYFERPINNLKRFFPYRVLAR